MLLGVDLAVPVRLAFSCHAAPAPASVVGVSRSHVLLVLLASEVMALVEVTDLDICVGVAPLTSDQMNLK